MCSSCSYFIAVVDGLLLLVSARFSRRSFCVSEEMVNGVFSVSIRHKRPWIPEVGPITYSQR